MIEEYLAELTRRLQATLGDRLVSAWVIGSSALGDFDPSRSDIDVQAVSDTRLPRADLERLAAELSHDALPCPVRGLEFVLYAREDLTDPLGPAFQLNLNTGARMEQHVGFDPDAEPRFWFVLDVAIAGQQARALAGELPTAVLPALPRPLLVSALRQSLEWYRAHDRAEAVLAAARAWAWTVDGRWRSKGRAAQALIDHVERALGQDLELRPIGTVQSTLTDRESAPKQGDEGAPDAWLQFDAAVADGLDGVGIGDELLVLTWLDRARRDVLRVYPRGDLSRGEHGVFATRSPDRPNPIGVHRVRVVDVDGARLRVADLEALDGTPLLDVKPVLRRVEER